MSLSRKRHQGSVIMIAIFVIVVMGLLAAALSRIEWSNQDTFSRQILGNKAYFAAHSVNEVALTTIYPLNQPEDLPEACADWQANVSAQARVMSHYDHCSLTTQCVVKGELTGVNMTYYRIESSVICGSGRFKVQRAEDVWLKDVRNAQ